VPPPFDAIYFPSAMVVDPRPTADGSAAPFLFIANANSDLRFNGGTVVAFDLDAFYAAWLDPASGRALPTCVDDAGLDERCVLPPGAELSDARPCRQLESAPQIVECLEGPFMVSGTEVGSFGGDLTWSIEPDDPALTDNPGVLRLWHPIRGEASITYLDVTDVRQGGRTVPVFECAQGDQDGTNPFPGDRCGRDHRLTHLRNDRSLTPLTREPFRMAIATVGERRLGFVSHLQGGFLSLVDLGGLQAADAEGSRRPALVDQEPIFSDARALPGGFGLAERPCFEAGQGPLGAADPEPNVPTRSAGCSRPLMYGSFRLAPFLTSVAASGFDPADDGGSPTGSNPDARQFCASPDEVGEPGAVICEPQLRSRQTVAVAGVAASVGFGAALLGDIAFLDPRGDELAVLQTNPGALLRVDTSLDAQGEPRDLTLGPPIELCAEPSRMVVVDDGVERLAYVTCFRGFIFVVDLDGNRVVEAILSGTGPGAITVDRTRDVLYVANTLEGTISVVDISRARSTRFTEIARIGLQSTLGR
jgi:hypothetical protein